MSFLISNFFEPETHMFPGLFCEIDYCWEILSLLENFFNFYVFKGCQGKIEEGAIIKNPSVVEIGAGAVVESGACIVGPAIIGSGTTIRAGAYVREKVIVGYDCVIGHGTEIKNSIFFNQVKACHFAYIGNSVLGNRVNLGAGVKLANLRLDGQEVIVKDFSGNSFSTGLRKIGSFLGNDVSVGCNSVLNPGTFVASGAELLPLSLFSGIIN